MEWDVQIRSLTRLVGYLIHCYKDTCVLFYDEEDLLKGEHEIEERANANHSYVT